MVAAHHQVALRTHALFLTILSRVLLAAFFLYFVTKCLPRPAFPDPNLLVEYFRNMIYPKSTERLVFVSLCLLAPIYSLLLIRNHDQFKKISYSPAFSLGLPFVVAMVLFSPLLLSDYLHLLAGHKSFYGHCTLLLLLCTVASAITCLAYVRWQPFGFFNSKTARVLAWSLFVLALVLLISAWRVVSIHSASADGSWSVHIDAAIYAASQVIAGKTILVDLPSQYGLFPEFVAPLFKRIGATFINFSVFFASLQFISLLGLFFVMSRLIKNSGILLMAGISMLVITFTTMLYLTDIIDRYFQYWPVRFFWPAISVPVFYYFAQRASLHRSALLSFISAIGALWVMDTGLFIVLSFAAYLLAKSLLLRFFSKQRDFAGSWFYAKALGLHVFITAATISLFFTFLWLKAQQPLHFSWLFAYQKIFYGLGFMMMPMPIEIHPWMSVLGVYLFGLVFALFQNYQNKASLRSEVTFYLSILGVGIFIYYEGRSHIFNLVTVSWPALMIMTINTDAILFRIRNRLLPLSEIWLPIVAVAVLAVCDFNFVTHIHKMTHDLKMALRDRNTINTPFVSNEIEFIKQQAQNEQECLILTQRQGIYYTESGLASPVKGPGIVETVLQADLESLLWHINNGNLPCIFLGTGPFTEPFVLGELPDLREKYQIIAQNSAHSMLYFKPKTNLSYLAPLLSKKAEFLVA